MNECGFLVLIFAKLIKLLKKTWRHIIGSIKMKIKISKKTNARCKNLIFFQRFFVIIVTYSLFQLPMIFQLTEFC